MPGRNDPCPCGSGKKYKKCHGASATAIVAGVAHPDAARARALKAADVDLGERLLRFAGRRYGTGWLAEIASAYMDGQASEIPDVEMALAIPWGLHCVTSARTGLSVAEAWRRDQGKRATTDQTILLDAYASMWLSVWEVADVRRGAGTTLVDQLTREERFVHDVKSSDMLERLDSLLAFVLDCDGVSFFGGVHGQILAPRESAAVVKEARQLCHVRTRPVPADKLRDPNTQLDLIALWNFEADRLAAQPPPTMQNTDGDPIELTTDDYELVAPRAEVARRLESMDGAQDAEEERGELVVTITKSGNAMHATWDNTVVARVVLGARRLQVETNSTRRANAMRAQLESHMGTTIRFRLRSATNTRELMERAATAGPAARGKRAEEPTPEMAAVMRDYMEQHMKAWPDMKLPALGGHTPREAARLPRWRKELELLLKELEHENARKRPEERVDVAGLRGELGV